MAVKPAVAWMLVFVLVILSTTGVPCVGARKLQQFSGLTNGFGLPASTNSPSVNIPGADALTNAVTGLTNGLTNAIGAPPANFAGVTDLATGLTNAIGALPANFSGVTDLANGVTNAATGLTNGLTNAIGAPPANVSGVTDLANGVTNAANGVTNAVGGGSSGPSTASSTRKPEEGPGTTITDTFYISSTGLGSTTVTATTHIPPLNEIQIPDFKGFFSNLLPSQSFPQTTTSSSSSSSPSPPAGPQFPGFPGLN